MQFAIIVAGAIIVQYATEQVKQLIPSKVSGACRKQVILLLALAIGIILSVAGKLDFFTLCGITISPPALAYVFTGILLSGGSGFINEIIKAISETRPTNKKL